MAMICYNLGKINAHLNGNEVQLSYNREEDDPEWTRGNVQIENTGGCIDDVGFYYNLLSPAEARELADQLNYLADKTEEMYADDPMYVALEDGKPMYDSDSQEYVTYFSEEDAKRETKIFQENTNENRVYSYRPITVQEYWKWHKENVIE